MPEKPKPEPTEQTPKGLTVPVPSRERFFANLKKVARAPKPRDAEPHRPETHGSRGKGNRRYPGRG